MTAIRPPEYFRRFEYCALMLAAEQFVIADTFPFSRQSWHNRTKIRTPDEQGRQWLTVPRKHRTADKALNALELDASTPWARTHQRALRVNYSMAPFYERYAEGIEALLGEPYSSLGALTVATVKWVHEGIGAPSELLVASELPGAPDTLEGVWEVLGRFDTLITLPESAERDMQNLPDANGETFHFTEQPRPQNFPGFVPDLSVLDMLFNQGQASGAG